MPLIKMPCGCGRKCREFPEVPQVDVEEARISGNFFISAWCPYRGEFAVSIIERHTSFTRHSRSLQNHLAMVEG